MRLDASDELDAVGYLDQVIARAGLEGAALVTRVLLGGEHDDGDASGVWICAKEADQREAIDAGHHEILQDHRRLQLPRHWHGEGDVRAGMELNLRLGSQN